MSSRSQRNVLHLSPHAGGGVGTVLRAIIKASRKGGTFIHTLCTLEPLNTSIKKWCAANNVEYLENGWTKRNELHSRLANCDIVHIHWWNHPLLHSLFSSDSLPEMRTILWSHVNGMFVPQIFFKSLVDFPDFFVLATPYSQESSLLEKNKAEWSDKIRIIQSNAGIPSGVPGKNSKPEKFRVGYIGTVDYCKMHDDFISFWCATEITELPLIVCGGPSYRELIQEVSEKGVAHLFDIRGNVTNVPEILSDLHVFMYPLNSTHYGTGEQVLLEAMAFGAVPVVMNNGSERFVVQDGKTGIVATDKDDFVRAILFLKNNPHIRQKMAEEAREYVQDNFGIEGTVHQWHRLYNEVLKRKKRKHHLELIRFENVPKDSTTTLMLNSYGDSKETEKLLSFLNGNANYKEDLSDMPPACFSKTRGSPFHYQNALPDDPILEKICRFLTNGLLHEQIIN